MKLVNYPQKILDEPLIIAPLSALSPILATNAPAIRTVDEPAFTFATCGGQGGAGGCGCDTVGSPTLAINIPFALTVDCVGVSKVVTLVQTCPVVKLSPFRQIAGIY